MKPKTAIGLMLALVGIFVGYLYSFTVFADTSYYFGRNLSLGSNGSDVMNLQKALNSDAATRVSMTGVGSLGNESSYFGTKTRDAVVKFQRKYGITPAAGYVGPITRAKLNSLSLSQESGSISPVVTNMVCNENLSKDGLSPNKTITLGACKKLNELYKTGQAAGNVGDTYVNRDNLHVNFCVGWTPNPECPLANRLFPQHEWKISGGGFVSAPFPGPTVGQASYSGSASGDIKHSLLYDKYKTQSGADTLYTLYTNNNLFIYPSLYEDSFKGSIYDTALLNDPRDVDEKTDNSANTPYLIGSRQICDCGAGSLRIHDASGSDLPFIELALAGLAAFKPDVKKKLVEGIVVDGKRVSLLIPTVQSMLRRSHRSVVSDEDYLKGDAHKSSYIAHVLSNSQVTPAYDAEKLVSLINSLTLDSVPPLARLSVVSETFNASEKTFTTPGAISRIVSSAEKRSITLSLAGSVDPQGSTSDMEYRFIVLKGAGEASITVSPTDSARATIEFDPHSETHRIDVGAFVKKKGSEYYSVPGIVSLYVRS
jgi:hypothetical protein